MWPVSYQFANSLIVSSHLQRRSRAERPLRNSSWYISRGALAVILNGAERSEESKAFARKTALSWDETLWILRCTQNDIQPGCRAGYAKVSADGSLLPCPSWIPVPASSAGPCATGITGGTSDALPTAPSPASCARHSAPVPLAAYRASWGRSDPCGVYPPAALPLCYPFPLPSRAPAVQDARGAGLKTRPSKHCVPNPVAPSPILARDTPPGAPS